MGMTSPRETAFTLNSNRSKKNETAKKVAKKPEHKQKVSKASLKLGRLPQPMQVPLTPQARVQKPNSMQMFQNLNRFVIQKSGNDQDHKHLIVNSRNSGLKNKTQLIHSSMEQASAERQPVAVVNLHQNFLSKKNVSNQNLAEPERLVKTSLRVNEPQQHSQ